MNAKVNNEAAKMTIEQQIAALQELVKRRDAVMAIVGDDIQAIRELNAAATESKNAADQAGGQKASIWEHVFNVAAKVYEVTADAPDTRYQVFTDAMDEFINPRAAADGEKVKLTTAGQYASTGRKMLVGLWTDRNEKPDDWVEKSVADVRKAFKDAHVQARLDVIGKITKDLRYAAKYATDAEYEWIATVVEAVAELYNPVKARKDKASKKAEADREIRDLQQQAPSEPAVLEKVAGAIAAADEPAQKTQVA